MEILAPAGSMQQANAAIEAGCDAIYGGLEKWSARNRAENFSIKDYDLLIKKCRKKNVKFYLTLNTLMTNNEIELAHLKSENNKLRNECVKNYQERKME